jgi:CrcB protein
MPFDSDVTSAPPAPPLRALIRPRADLLPVIAVGGALGSLARWGLASAFPHAADEVAWGTVLANVSGSLLLGLLMAFVLDVRAERRYVRPFLGVGVLGGFTTFSTYVNEIRGLLRPGSLPVAAAYLAGTLACALLAVLVGIASTRAVVVRRSRAEERDEDVRA